MINNLINWHKNFFLSHHRILEYYPEIKPFVYFVAEKLDNYVVFAAIVLMTWFLWRAMQKESIKRFMFLWKESFRIVVAVCSAWLLAYLIKITLAAPRPFLRFPAEVEKLFHYGGFDSFPSGHATLFMALATMITLHHKRIGYLFIFFALFIALARVISGVHFPVDIWAGWILGASVSYFVYKKISW